MLAKALRAVHRQAQCHANAFLIRTTYTTPGGVAAAHPAPILDPSPGHSDLHQGMPDGNFSSPEINSLFPLPHENGVVE